MAYGLLQVDPIDSMPAILATISQQLSSLTVDESGLIMSKYAPYTAPPPSQPRTSYIVVNALLSSSLILSLMSASIGILIKQWLQEFSASTSSQVYESVCIRQYRLDGYDRWRVSMFMKLLPFLLQLSLLLFFIGLLILLSVASTVVTGIVGALVSLWFVCWMTTVILPTIYSACPYKSAEAWAFFAFIQSISNGYVFLCKHAERLLRCISAEWFSLAMVWHPIDVKTSLHTSWRKREMDLIKNHKPSLAWRVVQWTRDCLMDEMILATALRAYLKEEQKIDMKEVAGYAWKQLSRSTGVTMGTVWSWIPDNSKLTCAFIQDSLYVIKQLREHDQCEYQEALVVALARYVQCRSDDSPDPDLVRDIRELPLQVNLGGFPLKGEFWSRDHVTLQGIVHSRSSPLPS